MSTTLVTVNPSAMMIEAVRVMSKAGVGSALVLDGDSLVGNTMWRRGRLTS